YRDLPYSGFPSLGEILFWLVAPLESVIASRLINWICWLGSLFVLYRLLRRELRSGSAALVTSVFAISPTMLLISANCYVETILTLNVAAMLLAVRRLRRDRRRLAAILGALAGGAAAVKLTGFAAVLVPCLWYAGEAWQRHKRLVQRGRR